jgi:predicted membrane-bound spermidine synthase
MSDAPTLPRAAAFAVAFLSGFAIMQLEILGGRMLAPYFGYSIYQWGALIGVVMSALAVGYWLGGRVGDGAGAARFLLVALAASAAFAAAVPHLAERVLAALSAFGPAWGAVAASAALLAVPSALLATASPILIRLTADARVAMSAGRVYAIATLGSIAGTFATAFFVIPELGARLGQYLGAGIVAAALIVLALARRDRMAALAGPLVLVAGFPWPSPPPAHVIHRAETVHNRIEVHDLADSRLLFLNYTDAAQTIEVKGRLLTDEYYDLFLVGPLLSGGKRVLVLGAAGGIAIKQMVTVFPAAEVTGVDLDPAVLDVARRYFGLAALPRTTLVAEDARWFLARRTAMWDVIVVDLYVTGRVPFFTVTREFFALARSRLAPGGLLMMNILAARDDDAVAGPIVRTALAAFPEAVLIGQGGNIMLLAGRDGTDEAAIARRLAAPASHPALEAVTVRARATLRAARADRRWPLLTDDRNDIEFRGLRR